MDKSQIKSAVHNAAQKAATAANTKAKATTGWQRWVWGIIAIIAAAIAFFTQQGCTNISPQQVHAAHVLYHAVTGEPCTLAQPAPVVASKK